jgi:hypothetical protein
MTTIVSVVARACSLDESVVRDGHGGMPRSVAAWLGCYEGLLRRRAIAAGLRLATALTASPAVVSLSRVRRKCARITAVQRRGASL